MKTAIVQVHPGSKASLSQIDPDGTGGASKRRAINRLAQVKEELIDLQEALFAERRRSLLVVFQAMDTGGKDGAIKHLAEAFNPAGVRIANFKAPNSTELEHDFLWRLHKATPAKGMIGMWNRSHYEDVLIVRVHKLVKENVWKARYEQINNFEKMLTENGTTILKFMLHISKDEQKERLQARVDNRKKQWKFNPNDLKERVFWEDYQHAYEDAINYCTTKNAPWYVVPANHKWARNLAVLETVLAVLKRMRPRYPTLSFDPKAITID